MCRHVGVGAPSVERASVLGLLAIECTFARERGTPRLLSAAQRTGSCGNAWARALGAEAHLWAQAMDQRPIRQLARRRILKLLRPATEGALLIAWRSVLVRRGIASRSGVIATTASLAGSDVRWNRILQSAGNRQAVLRYM